MSTPPCCFIIACRGICQRCALTADDQVRAQIDDAIVQALDLDAEWVVQVRRELSREPSVTGRVAE